MATIGYDGSRAFTKNRTGTENYSYILLRHLSKIDSKNHYIIYLRPGNTVNITGWPVNFEFRKIHFTKLWTQVGLSLELKKNKPDVLFVPAHTIPLFKPKGLKTVMTVHDLGAEFLPATHLLKQRLYLKWISKVQLKSATRLIAVSKATKEDLIKKVGVKPEKIEVIYEGIDTAEFKRVNDVKLREKVKGFGLRQKKYFFFIGTIQPRKNLINLIKAFNMLISSEQNSSRHDDLDLALAGGKGWLSDEIYELPERLGIKGRVKFLGRVTDEDLPYLYSGAAAFTYPSLFEGFGLPILEAQACGTPVITSNVSSMPEVAGDAALLVNPGSVRDIASAMEVLVNDKNLAEKLTLKGYENVHRFSWEKCAKETLKVLTEVVLRKVEQ